MGCQYTMKANEMQPRTGNERGQALQEFQRGHHEVGGAIAIRGFELEDDLAGWGAAQSFVAQGGTRDVAAQPFELLALLGAAVRIGYFSRETMTVVAGSLNFHHASLPKAG